MKTLRIYSKQNVSQRYLSRGIFVLFALIFFHNSACTLLGEIGEPANLTWFKDFDQASSAAKVDYRSIMVMFSSPDCKWCKKMKADSLMDDKVRRELEKFVLLELDVTKNREIAAMYGLIGVPVIMFATSDGVPIVFRDGYVAPTLMLEMIDAVLNPEKRKTVNARLSDEELTRMLKEDVDAVPWDELILDFGKKEQRNKVREQLLSLSPFPRKSFVLLLEDPRLAVRSGALEILETVSGESFDFDPWRYNSSVKNATQGVALRKWQKWALDIDANSVGNKVSVMKNEDLLHYFQDLISGNRDRSMRAQRVIEQGGIIIIPSINWYLDQLVDVPEGMRKKIQEVKYTILLDHWKQASPSIISHRLLFGNLDMQLGALRTISSAGEEAVVIFKDFISHPDSLVRESACEHILKVGKNKVLDLIEDLIKEENDTEVIIACLRGLGNLKNERAKKILCSYLNHEQEDLVIIALEGLVKQEAKSHFKDIGACLEDVRWRVRISALSAAGKLNLKKLSSKVMALARDEDAFVRYNAIQTASKVAKSDAKKQFKDLFMEFEDLRVSIIKGYGAMDESIPKQFDELILESDDFDMQRQVISALKRNDKSGLRLLLKFVNSEKEDISLEAIRSIASNFSRKIEARNLFMDLLDEGDPQKVLILFQSINIDSDAAGEDLAVKEEVDEGSGGFSRIDEVATLFIEEYESEQSAAVVVTKKRGLLNVFADAIFGSPDSYSSADKYIPVDDLVLKILPYLGEDRSDELRTGAALLIAQLGSSHGVDYLISRLDTFSTGQRQKIISSLDDRPRERFIPLIKILMNDKDSKVRADAVGTVLSNAREDVQWLKFFFETLSVSGNLIDAKDVFVYSLASTLEKHKHAVRKYVFKALEYEERAEWKNLWLFAIAKAWRSGDEKYVEKYFGSENEYTRRAAWYALFLNNKKNAEKEMHRILKDPSRKVREIIPLSFRKQSHDGISYLDEKTHMRDYHYRSRAIDSLSLNAKNALNLLLDDDAFQIRFEAGLTLIEFGEKIDLDAFWKNFLLFQDKNQAASSVLDTLYNNYASMDQYFKPLTKFFQYSTHDRKDKLNILSHFKVELDEEENDIADETKKLLVSVKPDFEGLSDLNNPTLKKQVVVDENSDFVFFMNTGCRECKSVKKMLNRLSDSKGNINFQTYDLRLMDSLILNEVLCEYFSVPQKDRRVAPAIFSGGGFLVKEDISDKSLKKLYRRSMGIPKTTWFPDEQDIDITDSEEKIEQEFELLTFWVVIFGGLIDGVNPCAFATIIFFLSYLRMSRRSSREILQIGLAFVIGVFLAYLGIGFGFIKAATYFEGVSVLADILTYSLAGIAFVLMVLSIRDGVLCARGQLKDTTLKLPHFLRLRINRVIRQGMKQRHFVTGAFITGVIISLLELACTGQVYAPILFMIQKGENVTFASFYLLLYNLAFILPLLIVVVMAWFGLTHEQLLRFFNKNAAAVKFATAFLFAAMFLYFIFI